MSELKMISPLLDDMIVEKERVGCNGRMCRTVRSQKTREQFILKVISLPESDSRIRALILSGAYADETSVHEYYGRLAQEMKAELLLGQKLSATDAFAGAVTFQIEPKATGIGYDIYILYPMNISLTEFLSMNAMTHLRALNMGIDLCDSVAACRNAGYLFQNIQPDTIFLMPTGKFLLGDIGLTSLEFLQYAGVPEEYLGVYSAPELSDITASANLTMDLYALGMVLYRIYNGNHGPFEDESTNAAMAEKLRLSGKPLPSPIYADYELAGIILKACSFQQNDRFRSPEELKQALMLYMQRNAISDDLIVPPIIADPVTIPPTEDDAEIEPIRMTDVSELDEDFRRNFAPDLSGSGDDITTEPAQQIDAAPGAEDLAPGEPAEAEADDEPAETEESAQDEDTAKEELPAPEAEAPAGISVQNAEADRSDTANMADNIAVSVAVADETEEPRIDAVQMPEADDITDETDLDLLLSSVNELIAKDSADEQLQEVQPVPDLPAEDHTASAEAEPSSLPQHDYVDTTVDEPSETQDEQDIEMPKRARSVLWASVITLLIGLALAGYFLLNWYFVDVSELKTVYTTPTQIMVELVSKDNPNYFIVTCTDFYGNSYEGLRSGNQYCFTDLKQASSYTISVLPSGSHRFSTAAPVLKETTAEYTTISDISFERLEGDGNIRVNFNHEGPAPEQWKITYHKKGNLSSSQTANNCEISGLEMYETYVITVQDGGGVFIAGENVAEYQVLPEVIAKDFIIEDIDDHTVRLRWDFEGATPEKWALTCTADGMEDISFTTTDTFGEFTLQDFSRSYTFHLTALGISKPLQIVLDADTLIVSNLTAQANEAGEIVVTWDTPAGEPESGWLLTYRLKDCYYEIEPAVVCKAEDDNSVTLSYLPADALYQITLLPADTSAKCYGNTTLEVRTAKSTPYNGNRIRPAAPYGDGTSNSSLIALWREPDKEVWDFRDLNTARRTSYAAGEPIAFCVQIESADFSNAAQSDRMHLTYAVRNESGEIVACQIIEYADEEKTTPLTWGSIWFELRHTGTIPTAYSPTEVSEDGTPLILTGKFTVEIYLNGMLLAQKGFTVES